MIIKTKLLIYLLMYAVDLEPTIDYMEKMSIFRELIFCHLKIVSKHLSVR